MSQTKPPSPITLWRHPDFLKLWAAQSVSSVGSRITREGLPFAAVMSLGATPAQVGLLAAVTRAPAILVGLIGGGFVDRRQRRPILIAADLGRAVVLASIPLAAWGHRLSLGHIYAVAALVGALSVLFDIADHAYLPSLVSQGQLVEGNAKLATTEAVAEIGGPAVYGLLFQLLTAPMAIAVNAGTYLFSALALTTIRRREPPTHLSDAGVRANPLDDFRAGLTAIRADPAISRLLLIVTGMALFGAFFSALYMIMALRILHLTAGMLGLTVAVGGVSALFGAAIAGPVIRRFGMGPSLVVAGIFGSAANVFIPLAHGPLWLAVLMMMVPQLVGDSLGTIAEIAGRSLRQSRIDGALMGRVGGVFALAPGVTGIAGALLGGWLGGAIGTRPTLLIACAGLALTSASGLFSPLMRHSPEEGVPPS